MSESRAAIVILFLSLFIVACGSIGSAPSATLAGPRSIVLNGQTYSETELGDFRSWECKDYSNDTDTLVEVGTFSNSNFEGAGFILYDGTYSGEFTNYERRGINQRWDWGPNGADYSFVIEPDGKGIFYDFSSASAGESVSASALYECDRP